MITSVRFCLLYDILNVIFLLTKIVYFNENLHCCDSCHIFIFFQKKGIERTDILRLSNSKASSKVKHHLLTSLKVNDITKRASHKDICNVKLTAQGA